MCMIHVCVLCHAVDSVTLSIGLLYCSSLWYCGETRRLFHLLLSLISAVMFSAVISNIGSGVWELETGKLYTLCPIKQTIPCVIYNIFATSILTDVKNSFADRLVRQFVSRLSSNFPPHLKGVATLSCKILFLKD